MSTALTGKVAGSPASNQYGEYTVQVCSPKQASFIQSLLNTRKHSLPITDATTVNKKHASRIIDELLKCPKLVPDLATSKQVDYINALITTRQTAQLYVESSLKRHGVTDIAQLSRDNARSLITTLKILPFVGVAVSVTEVGAYRHGETYYSVRKSGQSGKLIAYEFDPDTRSWNFARGAIYSLQPSERLTLSEAKKFGVQTGQCVHCGRTLTDPISIMAGLGTVCIKRYA